MLTPLHDLMVHGVRVDVKKLAERHATLRAECRSLGAELDRLCDASVCECGHGAEAHPKKRVNVWKGVLRKDGKERVARWKVVRACIRATGGKAKDGIGLEVCECAEFKPKRPTLVGTKDISNAKLCVYLYDHLGLPEQKAPRGEGVSTRTANELACIRLRRIVSDFINEPYHRGQYKLRWKKTPKRVLKVLDCVLRFKRLAKLSTFLNVKKVDSDGRMRCSYKFTTITGRLASSKNPMGGGMNLQTPPRPNPTEPESYYVRECILPDEEGWALGELDYSMGETRILYAMTGDPEMMRLAQALPGEADIYKEVASKMFGVPLTEVTKQQRQEAKQTVLAGGYGMTAYRYAELRALNGEDKTVEECEDFLQAYFRSRPQVLEYQKWVRAQLMKHKRLVTGWGRELNVSWARLSKDVYKQGYAFLPQSTLGDALNQLGLIPIHRWLVKEGMRSRVNLQVHDALVLSCPPDEMHAVMEKLHNEMTRPIPVLTITGKLIELSIPVELKVGTDWSFKNGREFKALPTEKEVRRCLKQLT